MCVYIYVCIIILTPSQELPFGAPGGNLPFMAGKVARFGAVFCAALKHP